MASDPPFSRVDHLVIATRDLAAAELAYGAMLGLQPSWRGAHPELGTTNVIFGLTNCYLELLAPGPTPLPERVATLLDASLSSDVGTALAAIALGTDDVAATARTLRAAGIDVSDIAPIESIATTGERRRGRLFTIAGTDTRGVPVFAIEHERADGVPHATATTSAPTTATAVDHVVLLSDDLDAGVRLWRDTFAIPERWRREFPARGTVNVGLRLGGVTIELVAPLGGSTGARGERLWGVAYRVGDCDGAVARLRSNGVPVGDAHPGLAPATRVATVKWTGHVPTLLLQHTAGPRHPPGAHA